MTRPTLDTCPKSSIAWMGCRPSIANAAGMDIGADEIVVAVPPDRDPEPVRAFRTFTPDLQTLVAWLVACRIDTVAIGINRRLLDSDLRTAGAAWHYPVSGQRPPCQDGSRSQERLE